MLFIWLQRKKRKLCLQSCSNECGLEIKPFWFGATVQVSLSLNRLSEKIRVWMVYAMAPKKDTQACGNLSCKPTHQFTCIQTPGGSSSTGNSHGGRCGVQTGLTSRLPNVHGSTELGQGDFRLILHSFAASCQHPDPLLFHHPQWTMSSSSVQDDPRRTKFFSQIESLLKKLTSYAPIDAAVDQKARDFLHDCLPPMLTPGIWWTHQFVGIH